MGIGAYRYCAILAYLQQLPARGVEAACVDDGAGILTASLWVGACLRRTSRDGAA